MRCFQVFLIAAALAGASARVASATELPNLAGFYAGLNAGWSWYNLNTTSSLTGSATTSAVSSSSWYDPIGGVQLGYNWQPASKWLVGVEADFQASGVSASSTQGDVRLNPGLLGAAITETLSRTDSLDWFGTVRGRLGYAVWPNITLYGTGGLAYGGVSGSAPATVSRVIIVPPFTPETANATSGASAVKAGWTAGAGIEGAVPNSRMSWKVEYLHIDLAALNYGFNAAVFSSNPFQVSNTLSSKFGDDMIRVGLNLHFN